jgi:translation initiation factor IF-2
VFYVVPSEREARVIVDARKQEAQRQAVSAPKATLEELFTKFQAGEIKELRLIIKADVQGSLEPIMNSLKEVEKGDINLNILQAEAGNISDNDVMLAAASKAIIVGFSVQADATARRLAEAEGVSIRLYDIIYRLTEDIEKALKGMLAPEFKEVILGRAEVKAIFKITKVGAIAGCRVTTGEIRRSGRFRVVRSGQVVHEGELASLKHERDDVREVRQGLDCGMGFKNFNEFVEGDFIECFTLERFGA